MRKYIAFAKATWQLTLAYRGESFIWLILEIIPMLIFISFWNSLLITQRITHAQFSHLVLYYLLTLIVSRLTAIHFEDWIIEEIKDGKISRYLLKPFSYKLYLLSSEITWRFSGLIYLLPALLLFIPILSKVEISSPGLLQISGSLLILFLAFLQRYFLGFLIGIAAFWFEQSKSLIHLKWMCEGIFGGAWLPLYFFPDWLQKVARVTPFYSWFFYPLEMLLKPLNASAFVINLALAVFWTLSLWQLSKLLWKKAIVKYSAVGN